MFNYRIKIMTLLLMLSAGVASCGSLKDRLLQQQQEGQGHEQNKQVLVEKDSSIKHLVAQKRAGQALDQKLKEQAADLKNTMKELLKENGDQHQKNYQELLERSEKEKEELLKKIQEGQEALLDGQKSIDGMQRNIASIGCFTIVAIAGCFAYVIKYCSA